MNQLSPCDTLAPTLRLCVGKCYFSISVKDIRVVGCGLKKSSTDVAVAY